MEDAEFVELLSSIDVASANITVVSDSVSKLYKLSKTSQIRDYEWLSSSSSGDGEESNCPSIYSAIWKSLRRCWSMEFPPSEYKTSDESSNSYQNDPGTTVGVDIQVELQLLEIWYYIVTLPEYDHSYAANLDAFTYAGEAASPQSDTGTIITRKDGASSDGHVAIPGAVLNRIIDVSTAQPAGGVEDPKATRHLIMLKALLHWSYSCCHRLRAIIRAHLSKALVTAYAHKKEYLDYTASASAAGNINSSNGESAAEGRNWKTLGGPAMLGASACPSMGSTDAGSSRRHVRHLLAILHCIISGLDAKVLSAATEQDNALLPQLRLQEVLQSLLMEVLMPLHEPNEMVEWRDQVPVLQVYHEALVQCVVLVAEKDRHLTEAAGIESQAARRKSLLALSVEALLLAWPDRFRTNTPKQVLLLHELEILLSKCSNEEFLAVKTLVLQRLVRCIGTDSDNIRPAQRALQIFRNRSVVKHLTASPLSSQITHSQHSGDQEQELCAAGGNTKDADAADCLRALIPALYRSGELSWNPTVNKMTGLAMQQLKEANEDLFKKICRQLFGSGKDSILQVLPDRATGGHSTTTDHYTSCSRSLPSKPMLPPRRPEDACRDSSSEGVNGKGFLPAIPSAMPPADGTPPSVAPCQRQQQFLSALREHSQEQKQDQVNEYDGLQYQHNLVEGSADASTESCASAPMAPPAPKRPIRAMRLPPASTGTGQRAAASSLHQLPRKLTQYSAENPPPVTITGVAPWAMPNAAAIASRASLPDNFQQQSKIRRSAPPAGAFHTAKGGIVGGIDSKDGSVETLDGDELVDRYIKLCLPESKPLSAEEQKKRLAEDWNCQQAAATPTLLPDLKFHDLVFGAVLGEGAFGVVKYARRITKEKSQSDWAEFAVKIIAADRIAELQYRSSVLREMAILQLLSHPGVSRMVAAFRYKDSAYLVLEYAARGDLHSYLLRNGKLSHTYARFIAGELIAALKSVHELGFSYGDLKPENVLLTELGHVKLTDFGACRPISAAAERLLKDSANLLQTIRNGDWKDDREDQNNFACASSTNLGEEESSTISSDALYERLEGTPAYLPPEVLLLHQLYESKHSAEVGSEAVDKNSKHAQLLSMLRPELARGGSQQPSPESVDGRTGGVGLQLLNSGLLSDAWALGCLLFFCLHGRPLYYGDVDQVLDQMEDAHRAVLMEQSPTGLHFAPEAVSFKKQAYNARAHHNHRQQQHRHQQQLGSDNSYSDSDLSDNPLLQQFQDQAADELIAVLTSLRPSVRASIEQCAHSDYLILGYRKEDQDAILSDQSTDSTTGVTSLPTPMKPLLLHKGAPMPLPQSSQRNGADLVDQQWTRRQFSVLWAPMPADYKLEPTLASVDPVLVSSAGSSKLLGESSNSDLWLMNHAYRLLPIPVSSIEAYSRFSIK